ncbi:hypothetical protein B0H14DRAFT_3498827 [Mycena olivaceomarginata]|nr:hypothetical protein B0H14DRAFT_3498827 [Mycena olivaceomarginata]
MSDGDEDKDEEADGDGARSTSSRWTRTRMRTACARRGRPSARARRGAEPAAAKRHSEKLDTAERGADTRNARSALARAHHRRREGGGHDAHARQRPFSVLVYPHCRMLLMNGVLDVLSAEFLLRASASVDTRRKGGMLRCRYPPHVLPCRCGSACIGALPGAVHAT